MTHSTAGFTLRVRGFSPRWQRRTDGPRTGWGAASPCADTIALERLAAAVDAQGTARAYNGG